MKKKTLVISLLTIPFLACCSKGTSGSKTTGSETTEPVAQKVNVKFVSEDQITTYSEVDVEKGSIPTYTGETPTKNDDYAIYSFSGWTLDGVLYENELPAVNADSIFVATFAVEHEAIKVNWIVDGVATETLAKYNTVPVVPEAPTKSANETYTFEFKGWSTAADGDVLETIPVVTSDTNFYAIFESKYIEYTVSFVVDGNSTSNEYHYNDQLTAEVPSKDATAEYTYTFAGWEDSSGRVWQNDELPAVTANETYVAQFTSTKNKYTVSYYNDNGSLLTTAEVEYGVAPTTPADPTKNPDNTYTYDFLGWASTAGGDVIEVLPTVTSDVSYYAIYESTYIEYVVKFVIDEDASIDTYHYNDAITGVETPTIDSTAEYSYTFAGWEDSKGNVWQNDELPVVTANETYVAKFTSVKNKYTVTFLNDDGTEIKAESIEYGSIPTCESPTKSETVAATYEFSGWETSDGTVLNELPAVTGAATYKAKFTESARQYTTTINLLKASDGSAIQEAITVQEAYSEKNVYSEEIPQIEGYVANKPILKHLVTGNFEDTVYYSEVDAYVAGVEKADFAGTGTEADPYLISSVANWLALKEAVATGTTYAGSYFKLTKSLDFGGQDLGLKADVATFGATFDGGNCIIKGYNGTRGLFGYTTGTAAIKNLSVEGTVNATVSGSGGFACVAGIGTSINNCFNYVNVSTVAANCGGFYGLGKALFTNCQNYGTVKATHASNGANKTGGFVGSLQNVADSLMTNCQNYGEVIGRSGVGGLIGIGDVGAAITLELNNCLNAGSISSSYSTTNNLCGGLFGGTNKAGISFTLNNCVNVGHVTATNGSVAANSQASKIGGLVGGNLTAGNNATITNSVNYGLVNGQSYTGGLVGYYNGAAGYKLIVKDCANNGMVQEIDTVAWISGKSCSSTFGGAVAYITGVSDVSLENVTNNAKIEGSYAVAGMIGFTNNNAITISYKNCVNNGEIYATNNTFSDAKVSYVAGMVGWERSTSTAVYEGCINTGRIHSKTYGGRGGMIGYTGGNTNITLRNCVNYGDIDEKGNSSGGIVGGTTSGAMIALNIEHCKNYGNISGAEAIGGIIGNLYEATAGTASLVDNINYGEVTGTKNVGDIIGLDHRTA